MADNLSQLEDRYIDQLQNIDELVLVVLKGHLLIEEMLSKIIEDFVFHPESVQDANLRFYQKVCLARSMSLDDNENSMWNLIGSVNGLRNELAHALESPKRDQKIQKLKSNYIAEVRGHPMFEKLREGSDIEVATFSIGMSLGFLHSFIEEVARYKQVVNALDHAINPHRYQKNENE